MKPAVDEIRYAGLRGIAFSDENYEAVLLPDKGANLVRLFHKKSGRALLREPSSSGELEEKKFEFGTPVLFFPNRIEDGRFIFRGREYRFPVNDAKTACHLHGFLWDKPWRVVEAGVSKAGGPGVTARLLWGTTDEELELFPHPCGFTIVFTLTEKGLRQEIALENLGDSEMPVGLGYHTSFSVPSSSDHEIVLSVGEKWEMGGRHFPTGRLLGRGGEDRILLTKDSGRIFGHYTLEETVFEKRRLFGVLVRDRAAGLQCHYLFDRAFANLVVWNKTGEDGFICLEPQTCAINAFNLDLPASKTGVRGLKKGETFRAAVLLGAAAVGSTDTIIPEGAI